MNKEQSHDHHYVPQWYQRRFLPAGKTKLCYLDLHLDPVVREGVRRRHLARLAGPKSCFYQTDLNTLRLGAWSTDEMERFFFGAVDTRGHQAVETMGSYDGLLAKAVGDAYQDLLLYLGAQRFRTPRALDWIKKRSGPDHNKALVLMQETFQRHATVWSEGVWEIARAQLSPTKFILTDGPVTFYNKSVFPSEWLYPNDVALNQIGTRTLFPLGPDSCLIITHLQLVRYPRATPTEIRENARSYDIAMKHLGDIQFGRELEEDEVLRINYMLKKRASRYIAAAEEEWLYPEHHVSTTHWAKLDDDWLLFPHLWKVGFTTGIMAGSKNGSVWAADEYGRHPWNPGYEDESRRDREWVTAELAKQEWAKKRLGKSRAHTARITRGDVMDEMMEDYLRDEGLLPAQKPA